MKATATFKALMFLAIVGGLITAEWFYWHADFPRATYFTAEALIVWRIGDWVIGLDPRRK